MPATPPGFALSLPLGLGCSRLGSVLGLGGEAARTLIATALDQGISFFDTADIYAQGDSERLLGEVLRGRRDCIVCTKVGQHLPMPGRALAPVKRLVRAAVSRSPAARPAVAKARARPMPTDSTPAYLARAIEASLARLGRDHAEILLLHGPTEPVLAAGEAIGALEAARQAGKIGLVGISTDDVAAALAALADDRIRALQIPLLPGEAAFEPVLARAAEQGVAIIANEVLGGPRARETDALPEGFAARRIAELAARPDIAVTLVGTTRERHLLEAVEAAGAAWACREGTRRTA